MYRSYGGRLRPAFSTKTLGADVRLSRNALISKGIKSPCFSKTRTKNRANRLDDEKGCASEILRGLGQPRDGVRFECNLRTGAVSKGMSAVMPFLKCAPFTLRNGGSRSLYSSFVGVKWEKILGLKPFETTPSLRC